MTAYVSYDVTQVSEVYDDEGVYEYESSRLVLNLVSLVWEVVAYWTMNLRHYSIIMLVSLLSTAAFRPRNIMRGLTSLKGLQVTSVTNI